ncbi:MAG: MATE family efflux transporter [Deltaproteobacteria bacterium]|nr:MATE family efflux transporter [Deltaproteobacteria bacterium]
MNRPATAAAPPLTEPASNSPPRRAEPERLLAAPPLRAIVRLAAPTSGVMVIAAVSNILYTYFVSRLGAEAIAAVSLVFPLSLIATTMMGGGIGSGAASAVARALGAGRKRDAVAVAEHALVLSVATGALFGLGILVGGPALFRLMGGTGVVLERATVFAQVLFGGAAITFVGGMLDSILRGEGNVRVAAVWSTMSILLQIVLTPVFMFWLGLNLPGAAMATLASQLIATVPRAYYVFSGRSMVTPALRLRGFTMAPLAEILRVGIPASLSTLISYVGIMTLTGVLARLGDAHLAAYGLGTRLDFLMLTLAYGFGAAVLTLVGMATGAQRPDRARAYVVRAGAMIVSVLAVPSALLCWRPELWLNIFTHDPGIHAVGEQYFRIIGPSYPFVGVSMVIAFAFQGLGRATLPLMLMTVRVIAVLAVSLVCTQWLGMADRAVFISVAVGNVCSAAVMVTLFTRTHRGLRRRMSEARAASAADRAEG